MLVKYYIMSSVYAQDTTYDVSDIEDDAQSKPTSMIHRQYAMNGTMPHNTITTLLYTVASANGITLSPSMTVQYLINNCKWSPYISMLSENFRDTSVPIAEYLF